MKNTFLNKIPAFTDTDIWVVGTSNQHLKEVLKLKQNFQKYLMVPVKTFLTPYFIYPNLGFLQGSFV